LELKNNGADSLIPGKVNHKLIFLLVLAGALVRFYWGACTHAWLGTPDQLAWGLGIDEMQHAGELSYKKLITYPHEGGSFMVGLFSILFYDFPFMPSLSWTSLLLDSLVRFIQIVIAYKLFGNRIGFIFGIWTIFSVPLILPWGTVNFCQHATASEFPFLFVYTISKETNPTRRNLITGALTGCAIWFSYTSVVLIPAYILWLLTSKEAKQQILKQVLQFTGVTLLFLLPHLFLRLIPSNGFELNQYAITSIRGVEWHLFSTQNLKALAYFWYKPLPSSLFLSSTNFISSSAIRWIVFGFMAVGLIFAFSNKSFSTQLKVSASVILFFVVSYAFSPFYSDSILNKSHVYYRHLTYIMPLIILLMIHGFTNSGKFSGYLNVAWLLLCLVGTIYFIKDCKTVNPTYRNAGWVLAAKFGSDTGQLMRICEMAPPDQRQEVMLGFGWGLAATLLEGKSTNDTSSIKLLDSLQNQFPPEVRSIVHEGIEYAFSDGVTPVLDKNILNGMKGEVRR